MVQSSNLPKLIEEWVGREDFLEDLTSDWTNSEICVTGIIGFGGEGKTTLTRRWLNIFLDDAENIDLCRKKILNRRADKSTGFKLKGIFWYSFTSGKSVDEFFEDALQFFVAEEIEEYKKFSVNLKAQILLAFFRERSYILVLDGVESCQYPNGDEYGLFKNRDLSTFIRDFARGFHQSFCIISSRVPIVDLVDFSTYTQRVLKGLSDTESTSLLRKLGVRDSQEQVNKVIQFWKGYALGISITGSYFASEYGGEIKNVPYEVKSAKDESHYEKLFTVFDQYKDIISGSQNQILYVLSAMRQAVPKENLQQITPIGVDDLKQLFDLKVVDCDSDECYSVHPLIRVHYLKLLKENGIKSEEIHRKIVLYYESLLEEDIPAQPTLKQLFPAIECVHHSCAAGDFEKANHIRINMINQNDAYVLSHQLGAYERALLVVSDFFPNGDTYKEPLVHFFADQAELISEVGFYLMCLGRLKEAVTFFERHKLIAFEKKDLEQISISCINLSELCAHTGQLNYCLDAAQTAVKAARDLDDKKLQRTALAREGWALHLRHGTGEEEFKEAEHLEKSIDPDRRFLYSLRGIQHADHLRRTQRLDEALTITEANLEICKENGWLDHVSQCHRVLGNIFEARKQDVEAGRHFAESLKNAQLSSRKDVLIRILLARGRWYAHLEKCKEAFQDLNEALKLAEAGCYIIYELSIRIALSLAYIVLKEFELAESELRFSENLSKQVGYFWGMRDVEEAFELLKAAKA